MPKKLKDDEKRNLENGDSDSHQHPDGYRHLARRNELHVVISGHGHFRSFSNQHIDDDGSTEERGYGIERNDSSIRRQRAEQIAEQG